MVLCRRVVECPLLNDYFFLMTNELTRFVSRLSLLEQALLLVNERGDSLGVTRSLLP